MQPGQGGWSEPPFNSGEGAVRFIIGQMNRKKDLMLASDGQPGTGKSTTTENLFRWVCHEQGWDPAKKIVRIFDTDHLLDVLAEGKMHMLYELDEAVNIFHNQDWAKKEMKSMVKVIMQMRIMRSIWGLNIPDYESLHPHLRKDRIPLRFYHPPHWGADGQENGPSQIMWKQERFGYRTGAVEHKWAHVGDFNSICLDDDPGWAQYEQDKIANFKRLVQSIKDERDSDQAKAAKRKAKSRGGKANPRKATNRPAPPTATQ